MAQAVSRRPPTAEARVRSGVSPCGICDGQCGTWTGSPAKYVGRSNLNENLVPFQAQIYLYERACADKL